ncbi:MAG: hypothetical protein ACXU85_19740 [Xanthobacteraceae bacterium]
MLRDHAGRDHDRLRVRSLAAARGAPTGATDWFRNWPQHGAAEPAPGIRPRALRLHRRHLVTHALGLVSLKTAESALEFAVKV